jgi:hypothetical protein
LVTESKGERAAAKEIERLHPDWELATGFEPGTGFDQVYIKRAADGTIEEYIIVEAKGPGAKLSTGAKKGPQMSKKWVNNTVDDMARDGDQLGLDLQNAMNTGKPKVSGMALEATGPDTAKSIPVPDGGRYNW